MHSEEEADGSDPSLCVHQCSDSCS